VDWLELSGAELGRAEGAICDVTVVVALAEALESLCDRVGVRIEGSMMLMANWKATTLASCTIELLAVKRSPFEPNGSDDLY
jgi:hypothetical protein